MSPTETSCDTKPTKDMTSTSDELASIEKFPSKSEVVPLLVPLTIMVAPGKGPSSPDTVPDIVWAIKEVPNNKKTAVNNDFSLVRFFIKNLNC